MCKLSPGMSKYRLPHGTLPTGDKPLDSYSITPTARQTSKLSDNAATTPTIRPSCCSPPSSLCSSCHPSHSPSRRHLQCPHSTSMHHSGAAASSRSSTVRSSRSPCPSSPTFSPPVADNGAGIALGAAAACRLLHQSTRRRWRASRRASR
jgi:hypothetical protein